MQHHIAVYIVSWTGQHVRAGNIYKALLDNPNIERIKIVYSDRNPQLRFKEKFDTILLDDSQYWGGKFQALMRDNASGSDTLIIHADADAQDWNQVLNRFAAVMARQPAVGVWAPRIEHTTWFKERVIIAATPDPKLSIVAQTDGIVFGFRGHLLERLRRMDFGMNPLGWGIDWVLIVHAFTLHLLAVIDEACLVHHPQSTGYQRSQAAMQQQLFLRQLDLYERLVYQFLNNQIVLNTMKIKQRASAP